jgi:hypothetical protein
MYWEPLANEPVVGGDQGEAGEGDFLTFLILV